MSLDEKTTIASLNHKQANAYFDQLTHGDTNQQADTPQPTKEDKAKLLEEYFITETLAEQYSNLAMRYKMILSQVYGFEIKSRLTQNRKDFEDKES